jgi:hypothetical protein
MTSMAAANTGFAADSLRTVDPHQSTARDPWSRQRYLEVVRCAVNAASKTGYRKNDNGAQVTTRRTAPSGEHILASEDISPKAAFTGIGGQCPAARPDSYRP